MSSNNKMLVDVREKCLHIIQYLRITWLQNPEEVLSEKLKNIGVATEKTDQQLLELFRTRLY